MSIGIPKPSIALSLDEAETAASAMSAADAEFGFQAHESEVYEKLTEFVEANKK